jgi:hypothetical protein
MDCVVEPKERCGEAIAALALAPSLVASSTHSRWEALVYESAVAVAAQDEVVATATVVASLLDEVPRALARQERGSPYCEIVVQKDANPWKLFARFIEAAIEDMTGLKSEVAGEAIRIHLV